MSLKKNTLIVFLEKHSLLLLGFFSTLILARMLSPTEIGLVSVALGISGIAHMFRDFGIGQYLVQEKELTDDRVKSAFTITLIIAWSLATILYASSFIAVRFYSEPRLEEIIQIMAISFLMLPFGSIGVSLLRREMLFKRLYFINTIPQILQTIAAIGLAYLDFSYMSLVYANLLGTSFTVILSIVLAPSNYKRGISFTEFKHIANYSTSAMMTNLLIEVNSSASDFIFSRTLGFDSAAIYSRAKGVLSLFYRSITDALRTIALPEIAKRVRDQEDMQYPFCKSMSYITVLAWPFYGFLYFKSDAIISVLYGDKWLDTAPILAVMALMSCVGIVFAFGTSFIIALGLQHHNLYYELSMTISSVLWLLLGSPLGLVNIAKGVILISMIRNIYMYIILKPHLRLSIKLICTSLTKSFSISIFSLSPVSILDTLSLKIHETNLVELSILSLITALSWFLAMFIFKHDLLFEIPLFYNLRNKKRL